MTPSAGARHPAVAQRPAGTATLLVALFLVGLNLRTTMASVPPLLTAVQDDLDLTAAAAGLLTGLPVAVMGLAAPAAHRLARTTGTHTAAGVGLAALTGGLALRLAGTAWPFLYGATLLAGLGIAVLGTVLPSVVKQRVPHRAGSATATYAGAMTLGSALAAGLAVPLDHLLGGWTRSLAAWALPAAVALLLWLALGRGPARTEPDRAGLPWRDRTAWLVSGYLTAQAVLFYGSLTWIAPAYVARGTTAAAAGALLAVFGVGQLVATLALPAAADRVRDPRPLVAAAGAATAAGLVGLILVPDVGAAALVAVLGAGLGAGFGLGLLLLVRCADTPAHSTRLSAMAFLVSYAVAAPAPALLGALRDSTGSFTASFTALLAVSLAQLIIALRLPVTR